MSNKPFLIAIESGVNECFEKLNRALEGLSPDELHWRPTLESNTIDWMVWHMARVEDNLINVMLQDTTSIWERDGWAHRIGIITDGTGAGMTSEEVRALPALHVPKVMEYYSLVRRETSDYFMDVMDEADLSRKVTNPRFAGKTGAWILGRLLCEEAEHLGQIEYIRGMMRGMNR